MAVSLVVVCKPGADWLKDDGTRLMPDDLEDWNRFHQSFCQFLGSSGVRYFVVPNLIANLQDRVCFVLEKHLSKEIASTLNSEHATLGDAAAAAASGPL